MLRTYEKLQEACHFQVLPNGLTVAVVPRKGFTRKLAYFVTDFGSIHTNFSWQGNPYQVPAGVAHFLEHKMFELPDRDVNAAFAALGGNVNAFTSYDMTAYYVSCTEHFQENLKLLLEFVSRPWFPADSVQREMGIIDQEIGMTADTPDSRVFEDLMAALYRKHPIRVPILGTSQTIREITPEILKLCHDAFYAPGNMILCVVGDVDPDAVTAIAKEVLGTEPRPAGEKLRPWQETLAGSQTVSRAMEVAMPMFQLAFKCEPTGTGPEAIRREIVGDLAAEALFGESSALYLDLYEKGLIDGSFGGGFESVDGCAMLTCGGDSDSPEAVRQAILAQAAELVRAGIPESEFLRMKRSAMGRRIRDLDSFDGLCFRICAYHFAGFDYFEFPGVYAAVTAEEVCKFLAHAVKEDCCGMAIIHPTQTKEEQS